MTTNATPSSVGHAVRSPIDVLPGGTVLFVLLSLERHLRLFDDALEALVERGVRVHLLSERLPRQTDALSWLERMNGREGFTFEARDVWEQEPHTAMARRFRGAVDYLRVVRTDLLGLGSQHRRTLAFVPRLPRLVGEGPLRRSRLIVGGLAAVYEALDEASPVGKGLGRYLRERRPAAVIVCPRLFPSSAHTLWIRAAREVGVPSALAIASWDNLVSKQVIRPRPDRMIVWNEGQRREAAEVHGFPAEDVLVTGAQCFDRWFDWVSSPRDAFCTAVGLDPSRPFVLYAGGSLWSYLPPEHEWTTQWLRELRASADPELRDIQVLVRPHPKRNSEWSDFDESMFDGVVCWPRPPVPMPAGESSRSDYFDSIYHAAAVVGLNTSAMVEAGVLGRPVLTQRVERYHDAQGGVLHFNELLVAGGGVLSIADTTAEHHAQLGEAIRGGDQGRGARFVEAFVRPHGLDVPATALFADAVVSVLALPRVRRLAPARVRALRLVLGGLGSAGSLPGRVWRRLGLGERASGMVSGS